MMEFEIDDDYLTIVTIRKEWSIYEGIPQDELTHEQLINILKGRDRCKSVRTDNHPEFSKFRDQLAKDGYIIKGTGWNADRAIKPFSVNGYQFAKGERFPGPSALGITVAAHKKHAKSVGSTV